VSSLGYRIKRHGEQLHAEGTHDWKTDAQLRDLTINSMSMDMSGNIYDYLGGIKDIRSQVIRLGPNSRVAYKLDPTSIMRYFKAVSTFAHPKVSTQDLKFIKNHVHLLADVVGEKKTQMNMISILKSPHRKNAITLMCELGVDKYLDFVTCDE
jgi:poly(A) polymerase